MTGAGKVIPRLINHRILLTRKVLAQNACFNKRIIYQKATAANLAPAFNDDQVPERKQAEKLVDPAFQRIDLSLENGQEAYKSKTNLELLRAILVFSMCSVKPLVDYNKQIMKAARRILGQRLFTAAMKATFYGQFVAGADTASIKPTVNRNMAFGVKSILDYSVEKDISKEEAQDKEMEACLPDQEREPLKPVVEGQKIDVGERYRPHEEFGDRREGVTSARTYFYENERVCDENMRIFLQSIDCVAGATNATGFAAIKVTALCRPQLLLQLSEVLSQVRRYFEILATATGTTAGTIRKDDFLRHLRRMDVQDEECLRWFHMLDATNDGEIDILDWHNLLDTNMSLAKLLRVPDLTSGTFKPLVVCLTEEEEEAMQNLLRRVDTIAKHAVEKDVRVMIDAEQTYFQPAINRLTMEMMRKYNREKAFIFNTYQCYLKDAHKSICTDLALSEREHFFFGAKLVRGAYMDQERQRALTIGYEDPINPSFEATSAMYEKVLTETMKNILKRPKGEVAIMVASHNEDTVRFTVNKMQELGICSTDKVICFGQLLGMCDQISFPLGQAGYSVYKYVPYGPVEEVLPYLSRRALENRGVLKKVKKEKRMLWSELLRRVRSGQWIYSPKPPTTLQS